MSSLVTLSRSGTSIEINGPVDPTEEEQDTARITSLSQGAERAVYRGGTDHFLEHWTLDFEDLTGAQWVALRDFFKNVAEGPTNEFDYTHTDGVTYTARFLDVALAASRRNSNSYRTRLVLELYGQEIAATTTTTTTTTSTSSTSTSTSTSTTTTTSTSTSTTSTTTYSPPTCCNESTLLGMTNPFTFLSIILGYIGSDTWAWSDGNFRWDYNCSGSLIGTVLTGPVAGCQVIYQGPGGCPPTVVSYVSHSGCGAFTPPASVSISKLF